MDTQVLANTAVDGNVPGTRVCLVNSPEQRWLAVPAAFFHSVIVTDSDMLSWEPAADCLEVGHWAASFAKGSAVAKRVHRDTQYHGKINMLMSAVYFHRVICRQARLLCCDGYAVHKITPQRPVAVHCRHRITSMGMASAI
jgi:hypothetical protein